MDILVVDDSSWMRTFIRLNLQQAGFEVADVEPNSAFDILEAMHRLRPRLLLTDYEMPTCNGESLLRLVREDPVLRDTPVIFLSAQREHDLVERLMRWNLNDYLVKPLRPEELVDRIRAHLRPTLGQDGPEEPDASKPPEEPQ